MPGSVEQIEQELAAIEQSSKILADEFYQVFLSYLKSLGNAVKKQLILASYHLCTQGYPEAFLGLSLKEKQEVQLAVRQVANASVQELSILSILSLKVEQNSQNPTEKAIADMSDETDRADRADRADETNATDIGIKSADMMNHGASLVLTNPMQISRWYHRLEKGIVEVLQTVSRQTNRQLQKYKIMGNNLPDILLDAAAKSSSYGELGGNMPNLLSLKIEGGKPSEAQQSSNPEVRKVRPKDAMNLLIVHLRLSDVEFADPVVMAGRNQIRQLDQRLSFLEREYQKKQQERIVAEAEAAWRSSWFEE